MSETREVVVGLIIATVFLTVVACVGRFGLAGSHHYAGPAPKIIYEDLNVKKGGIGEIVVWTVDSQGRNNRVRCEYYLSWMSNMGRVAGWKPSHQAFPLAAGVYNISLDTFPKTTIRDIKVVAGKRTIVALGMVCGRLEFLVQDNNPEALKHPYRVNIADSGRDVPYGDREFYYDGTLNAMDFAEGTYDVKIDTTPPTIIRDVKIERGKKAIIPMRGCGSLSFRVLDKDGKVTSGEANVIESGNRQFVIKVASNVPVVIKEGSYIVEFIKDINVREVIDVVIKSGKTSDVVLSQQGK